MTTYTCPNSLLNSIELGMTLDRYQALMGLPINAFNGLNKPDETPVYQCSTIWKHTERMMLQSALAQAEEMRERELNYHLAPKYEELELQGYVYPLMLDRKHLITLGTRTVTDISLAVSLDLRTTGVINDPVVVAVATTVTDSSELRVYLPGQECTITPSKIVIASGTATISIPRARLVNPLYLDDRDDPLDYYTDSLFIDEVDIKRVWYNSTTAMDYGWYGVADLIPTTTDTTQAALTRIADARLGLISHTPASCSGGVWHPCTFSKCRQPDYMKLRFVSGIRASMDTEMMTIRLAHTLLQNKPCSCPTVEMMWQEDHQPTKSWTPYGYAQGAMVAWLADSHAKIGMGGKFPRVS